MYSTRLQTQKNRLLETYQHHRSLFRNKGVPDNGMITERCDSLYQVNQMKHAYAKCYHGTMEYTKRMDHLTLQKRQFSARFNALMVLYDPEDDRLVYDEELEYFQKQVRLAEDKLFDCVKEALKA